MSFNDPFFDDFHKNTKKGVAGIAGAGCLIVLFNIIVTIAIAAGIIWAALFLLQQFGVI